MLYKKSECPLTIVGIVDGNTKKAYALFKELDNWDKKQVFCHMPQYTTDEFFRGLIGLLYELIPDVVFIDTNIGPVKGVEMIRKIKILYPEMRPVVISFIPDDMYAIEMLKAGAYEYIDKKSNWTDIELTIKRIHRDPGYYTSLYHEPGRLLMDQDTSPSLFSSEEIRFLQLNAKCLSLWDIGEEMSLSSNAVNQLLKTLYEKLGVDDRVEMVVSAVRKGIIKLIET